MSGRLISRYAQNLPRCLSSILLIVGTRRDYLFMKKIFISIKSIILVMILSTIVIACADNSTPPAIDPTQSAQILTGEYLMTLSQADIENSGLINSDLEANLGSWRFSLQEDGKFRTDLNGSYIADGKYTINGDQIEIYISYVCEDCECQGNIGRYVWALNENELRFAKIADSCDAMVLVLTKPLILQP